MHTPSATHAFLLCSPHHIWTEWQTLVKTLPCSKLHLWVVVNNNNFLLKGMYITSTSSACQWWVNFAFLLIKWIRLPTLALKPRGDITRNPKQGFQWPHKKGLVFSKKINKIKYKELLTVTFSNLRTPIWTITKSISVSTITITPITPPVYPGPGRESLTRVSQTLSINLSPTVSWCYEVALIYKAG